MRGIDAPTLKAWIGDGRELAILDAREDGEFGMVSLNGWNRCEDGHRLRRALAYQQGRAD